MKKLLFTGAILLIAVQFIHSKNYGLAGCGLGSIVIGPEPGMVQIFAATTNATSGSQLFGITSGTSNCTDDGITLKEKEIEYFANSNHVSIIQEIAKGEGEHLSVLASLYGCSQTSQNEFNTTLKSNLSRIMPVEGFNSADFINNVISALNSNSHLIGQCQY